MIRKPGGLAVRCARMNNMWLLVMRMHHICQMFHDQLSSLASSAFCQTYTNQMSFPASYAICNGNHKPTACTVSTRLSTSYTPRRIRRISMRPSVPVTRETFRGPFGPFISDSRRQEAYATTLLRKNLNHLPAESHVIAGGLASVYRPNLVT